MNEHEHELISRHLDGELSGADRDAALALLEESSDARELLASMQEMNALAQEAFPRTRFQAPARAKAHRPAVSRVAALAAAILVIAAGGLVYAAVEAGWIGFGLDSTSQPHSATGPDALQEDVGNGTPTVAQEGSSDAQTETAQAPDATSAGAGSLVSGRVQTIDGLPVEGALVQAVGDSQQLEGEPKAYASARSDSDGRFELDFTPYCDAILAQKQGFEPESVSCMHHIRGATKTVLLYLKRTGRVSGRVVTETGQPVAGAVVERDEFTWLGALVNHSVTDESGFFTADAINETELWIKHPDFACTKRLFTADETATATMTPGGQLRVRVVKRGGPVPNALVRISTSATFLPRELRQRTGPDGTALFSPLPPDLEYAASVQTEDGEFADTPTGTTFVRAKQTAECVLTLPADPAIRVTGTVYGPDGKPFPHAAVVANAEGGFNRAVHVRSDGTYSIPLDAGEYSVVSFAPQGFGVRQQGERVIVRASRVLDISMRPQLLKHIALRDVSGNPVTTAHVYRENTSLPSLVLHIPTGDFEFAGRTDDLSIVDPDKGTYAVTNPGQSMPPGNPIELVLEHQACAITGRVVDTEGKPLENVQVHAGRWATTGPNGEFRLFPFTPDAKTEYFGVSLPGYQAANPLPSSLAVGAPPVEIVMEAQNATLAGHVTFLDGVPARGASMMVRKGQQPVAQLTTDHSGAFRAKVARGGGYWIDVSTKGIRDQVNATATGITAPNESLQIVFPEPSPEEYAEIEAPQGPEYQVAEEGLAQMGIVFKMFAGESKGEKYPGLDKRFGVLLPDVSTLYPEYLSDTEFLKRLNGKQRAKFVYFGYAVDSESMADTFLDAYEEYGPEGLAGEDINVDDAAREQGQMPVYRLREGIERFFISDINDPTASIRAQSRVPVLWELPGSHEEAGGYVLFLDGHTEWVPYPGPFPMTESLVSRIQGVTAQAEK